MDAEVVRRAKAGDAGALEEIYNETRRSAYFTALEIVRNEDDAQDLVQESYVKAFRNLPRLRDDGAFVPWLKTIVANLSKNHLKKRKPMLFRDGEEEDAVLGSIEEVGEDFLPEQYADQAEKREIVKGIVESLPDLQRTAVILYYFNGLPLSEVARIMEAADGTTKSRLNYARKQIKLKVAEQERQGNRLCAGVPILGRILRLVSRSCDLPAEAAKNVFVNALRAAGIAAPAEPAAPAGPDGITAAAEGTAETAGRPAARGIFARVAGWSAKTRLIALIAAGVVVAGAGAGTAIALRRHNDAAQAAAALQQQQAREAERQAKEKAASEAAAKQKAGESAAPSSEAGVDGAQREALLGKLCGYHWRNSDSGVHLDQYVSFDQKGGCKFSYETIESETKTVREVYAGTYRVTGGDEIAADLAYSKDGIPDASKNCHCVLAVRWDWEDSYLKEMVTAGSDDAIPMSLILKSGVLPFGIEQDGKVFGSYYRWNEAPAASAASGQSSSVPASSQPAAASRYAADYLGMTMAQMEQKFGAGYVSPSNYEGGMVVDYPDKRLPFRVIFNGVSPAPDSKSTLKVVVVIAQKGQHADRQLDGGLTYQELKKKLGGSVGSPNHLDTDGSWCVDVKKSGYTLQYSWADQNGTQPYSTAVWQKQE